MTADREALGRLVRETWVTWAREQPDPKPSWLVTWDGLPESDLVAERRGGQWLLGCGDDWVRWCDTLAEADQAAAEWRAAGHGDPADVGVLVVAVQPDGPARAGEAAGLRELLAAVREALTVPFPATVGDQPGYLAVLEQRVLLARVALSRWASAEVSQPRLADPAADAAYLRDRLADHPPTGYQHYRRSAGDDTAGGAS